MSVNEVSLLTQHSWTTTPRAWSPSGPADLPALPAHASLGPTALRIYLEAANNEQPNQPRRSVPVVVGRSTRDAAGTDCSARNSMCRLAGGAAAVH